MSYIDVIHKYRGDRVYIEEYTGDANGKITSSGLEKYFVNMDNSDAILIYGSIYTEPLKTHYPYNIFHVKELLETELHPCAPKEERVITFKKLLKIEKDRKKCIYIKDPSQLPSISSLDIAVRRRGYMPGTIIMYKRFNDEIYYRQVRDLKEEGIEEMYKD